MKYIKIFLFMILSSKSLQASEHPALRMTLSILKVTGNIALNATGSIVQPLATMGLTFGLVGFCGYQGYHSLKKCGHSIINYFTELAHVPNNSQRAAIKLDYITPQVEEINKTTQEISPKIDTVLVEMKSSFATLQSKTEELQKNQVNDEQMSMIINRHTYPITEKLIYLVNQLSSQTEEINNHTTKKTREAQQNINSHTTNEFQIFSQNFENKLDSKFEGLKQEILTAVNLRNSQHSSGN